MAIDSFLNDIAAWDNLCNVIGTIYIYNGPGTSELCVMQTYNTLSEAVSKSYKIEYIGAEQIIQGKWVEDSALFIMPGGADLPYVASLAGEGNNVIKNYVTHGGVYLGICAGSYYAGKNVIFDKDGPLQVIGERELRFFSGEVVGPILAKYEYDSWAGCSATKLNWSTEYNLYNNHNLELFYCGGGYFKKAEDFTNIKIIATYNLMDKAEIFPAIIKINYGQGKVLLSGVHFEYSYQYLPDNTELEKIIRQLTPGNEQRKLLVKALLKEVEIT